MSDIVGVPGKRIRSFVERIEQIENEIKELNEAKKEVFSDAKGEGFDVKILKEIIKLRKQDQDERDEHETLLDVYMRPLEPAPPEERAEAACRFPCRAGGLNRLGTGHKRSAAWPRHQHLRQSS